MSMAQHETARSASGDALVELRDALQREYAQVRRSELRYRELFVRAPDPMLIVDLRSGVIAEVNASAQRLGLDASDSLVGSELQALFGRRAGPAVAAMLSEARSVGDATTAAPLPGDRGTVRLACVALPDASTAMVVVRAGEGGSRGFASWTLGLAEQLLGASVLADPRGHLLAADAGFLELAQLDSVEHARGRPLSDWIGLGET